MQRQFRSDDTSPWAYGYGNGVDGNYTLGGAATDAPIDSSCLGTLGNQLLSATNSSFAVGQIIVIHQTQGTGAGNWELNIISDYVAGTITTGYPLINNYGSGAQVLVLKQYAAVTISTGATLTAKAWNGSVGGLCAFLCNGTLSITGSGHIDLAGKNAGFGTGGGRMGFRGGNGQNETGEGTVGDKTTGTAANGNGGGAAPSGNNTGGGGGNAAAGSAGTSGAGGLAAGNAGLTSMVFGGGAGGGGNGGSSNGAGGGGGAILIIIAKDISCLGSSANSANGGNGKRSSGGGVGGSGGAGGSILIKGQTVALGSNLFTATAGFEDNGSITNGGRGSVGRIHVDYLTSLSGTTNPTLDSRQDPTLLQPVLGGSLLVDLI